MRLLLFILISLSFLTTRAQNPFFNSNNTTTKNNSLKGHNVKPVQGVSGLWSCPSGYSLTYSNGRPACYVNPSSSLGGESEESRLYNPFDTDTPSPPKAPGEETLSKEAAASVKSPSFSQCESAYKKTQVTCNGQTIAPAVTALLNSVAQMKSSGNMKAACESAKKVSA